MCKLLLPSPSLNVTIEEEGQPFTGQHYILTCTVVVSDGITSQVTVHWLDSSGLITSGDGITLSSPNVTDKNIMVTLEFNPFRDVHGGQLRCEASTTAMAPPYVLQGAALLLVSL